MFAITRLRCTAALSLSALLLVAATLSVGAADANPKEQKKDARPTPPTRKFDAPGAPKFTRLDGQPGVNPPANADGNFVIGPITCPPRRKRRFPACRRGRSSSSV